MSELTIGGLAKATGTKPETISYHERISLLGAAGRSGGNYRVYGNKELRRLSFVRRARDLGFSLDQVHDRSRSCGAVDKLARENLTAFEREIADLSARFAVSWGACSTNVAKARSPITASLMPSPQD